MEDWEDASLSIGAVALIFLCIIVTCWRLNRENEDEDLLLDNPV